MPEPNYEPPVSDGGGASAPPSAPPTGDKGVTPPSAPGGTGATPPSSSPSGGTSAAGSGSPPNNNGEWIPRSRLNEITDRARHEIARLTRELDAARTPKAPPVADPEADAIKAQFFKLFPAAEKLFNLQPEALERMLDAAPHMQAQTEHYWTTVGHQYLRQLEESMKKVYGGSPDVKARRWIETAFIDWVTNDQTAKERYINQDPGLVSDFWQSVESLMFEPVRRSAIASEQRRADRRSKLPIPGQGTQALGKGAGPRPKDEDELHERAYEAFEAARG